MIIRPERKPNHGISAPFVRSLLWVGIALMIGGELSCFFGPESYGRLRDIVWHIIFYSGATFTIGAVILYLAGRR